MKLPGETLTLLHRELINMHDGLTVILSGTNRLQQLYQKTQDGVIFLGNFQTRVIGCFSKEDAKALIRQTKNEGGEVKVSEEVIEQILQYAGTHPFLIQKLCHSLFQYGALREVKPEEDLILDAQLSSFFDIDFEQLDEEHQQVLLQFRWDEGLSADKIKGTPNINMTRAILRELEQLGFLRSENGVYWVGNYFLGLWLGERSSLQDTIPNEYTQPDSTLPSDKNPTLMQKLNVFISYSHKDEDFKEALDTHLTMLKRSDKIAAWNDRAILPGTEWDAEIKHQLEEAHIILLLVSANFIASQYIWKHELARAMERHEQREASIIPIFIKYCDWKGGPFDKLQGLPKDAKPVGRADNDMAWREVAQGVKAVAEAILSGTPIPLFPPLTTEPTTLHQPPKSSNVKPPKNQE
ncbi:MAG TPA: toll/interleukin-1 receptor domain-containing protein, partial [Saprospiraceae bacterium]|nr:toll/interleukin-1 receptor domain-containing protein [Saprospiraceae bacterium]